MKGIALEPTPSAPAKCLTRPPVARQDFYRYLAAEFSIPRGRTTLRGRESDLLPASSGVSIPCGRTSI